MRRQDSGYTERLVAMVFLAAALNHLLNVLACVRPSATLIDSRRYFPSEILDENEKIVLCLQRHYLHVDCERP